jgi:5'-3' exonuclease
LKLVLFDTNCLAHKAVGHATKHGLSKEDEQLYYASVLLWADSLAFIPKLRDCDDITCCWLTDSKPYWRAIYKPDYKGGRERSEATTQSLNLFHDCFELTNIPFLAFPQYEADDIAGAIVKLWAEGSRKYDEIFLVTLDSDWQGLVINEQVKWLNLLNYEPRVRSVPECFQWLVKDYNKAPKYKKKLFEMPSFSTFNSTDIWRWKGISGDKSDNIVMHEGTWLTNLFDQPSTWNLAHHSQPKIFEFIQANAIRPKTDWFEATQGLCELGLPFPIEPLSI